MTLYFGLKMTKQKIIQKPIDIDAHLKYRCPKCGYDYWISLREAKTKNFKIVCDCKTVFEPKMIKKIKISYGSIKKNLPKKKKIVTESLKKSTDPIPVVVETPREKPKIDDILKNKCVKLLVTYGFTKSEATDLIIKAYEKNTTDDPVLLVKQALSFIGESKNE